MRVLVFGLTAFLLGTPLAAQHGGDVEMLGRMLSGTRPPAGYYELLRQRPDAFQFSPDNGWIRRGRAIAAARGAARASAFQSSSDGLSAARMQNGVMQGDLNVPVLLVMYANTDSTALAFAAPRATMEQRIFGTQPAPPYSIYSYYREISNDNLNVNGTVRDWVRVSQNDTYYEGGSGCNGLGGCSEVGELIREAVEANDGSVDFSQFDNDGPDGIPNSADDDGYVDALVLFHPEVDGACGTPNVWAHRWVYQGHSSTPLATNDASNTGAFSTVRIRDYIIQGGQGGDGGCTAGAPQAMGVVAHELGHILGLPDLYDTSQDSEGIGHWGLMGSGNWRVPTRPAYMEAWSRAELGWVTEVPLTRDTLLSIRPVELSDTAFVIRIRESNEYFLLENRQRIGSDSMIHGPGLLVWHVDSARIAQRRGTNSVNAAFPHGLALEEADGRGDLTASLNRGDNGDPFPGSSGNALFGASSTPSSASNAGADPYIALEQITQETDGTVSVQVRMPNLVVRASDPAARVRVNGAATTQFQTSAPAGATYELDIDSVQSDTSGGTRYHWASWSNGQPRTHTITAPDTLTIVVANVDREYRLRVTTSGAGTVQASVPGDLATGIFAPEGDTLRVRATPDSGWVLESWEFGSGVAADSLVVPMTHPWDITARFAERLVAVGNALRPAVMGAPFLDTLRSTGGGPPVPAWEPIGGQIPAGLQLTSRGVLSGTPEEWGSFLIAARVTSGSQADSMSVTLTVSQPALTAALVVRQLVVGDIALSADEVHYLDLLGNRNRRLDVGDFLAWINATGGSVSAEEMAAVLRAAVREDQP